MRGDQWGEAPPEDQPLDLVVYRSRLLGSDPDLVVWGGGNTSVKTEEPDFRGRIRPVLRIKGSGTDLKTIDRSGFPGVFRDDLLPLLERDDMSDEEMTAYLEHCMLQPGVRRPSIETLLHAFLPARHVDHTHADAIVTLTNTARGEDVVRTALGERVAFVPYRRPGFRLAKEVYEAARAHDAVVLDRHGLVTWGETAEESYRRHIVLVEQAERWLRARQRPAPQHEMKPPELIPLLLRLRGRLEGGILRLDTSAAARAIANRPDIETIAAAGPATADHVLRIRPWACVIEGDDPAAAVDAYEARYREFFARYAPPDLPMLSPLPKVFLVPGLGMITAGADAHDAAVTAEVALHTLEVAARGTDVHGSYRSLQPEDLFHVEYWPLEMYKLSLAPPPREFSGKVIIVTGAASGIGRAIGRHLGSLGAQLALLDLNVSGLERTAIQIQDAGGPTPLVVALDLSKEQAVAEAVRQVITSYGGVDGLVSNAGIGAAGNLTAITPEFWRRSLEINTTTHFLITAEVMRAMQVQGSGGSIVFIASKNAFGPGAGFGAYSAAKAAQVQLARIAALEGGPFRIRSNSINPDAVFEDSGLWTEEVRQQRARAHGVPVEDLERFYAKRNLLGTTISGRDVAEAAAFLLSDRSRATTGTVITVDGGVAAAFPR